MTVTRLLAAALWLVAPLASAQCDNIWTPQELSKNIEDMAAGRAPVKYHNLATNITVLTGDTGTTLIPFATEQLGTKIIVFPSQFAAVVCKLAMAEYMLEGGSPRQAFEIAAAAAGKCFDSGRTQKACLVAFANNVGAYYLPALNALPARERSASIPIYLAALNQIALHEYAHHFLNHFARMKAGSLVRIDAEFEADMFAILNGTQSGEPASAMFYFFDALAAIEEHTAALTTNKYESGVCRAGNVENITGFMGVAPILLVDAAFGGNSFLAHNSATIFRETGQKRFSGRAPELSHSACSHITKVALNVAYAELRQVYLRFEQDADMLFAPTRALDAPRVARLLDDVSNASGQFQYMNGIAAKSMALVIRRWGLKQRLTPLSPQINRLLGADSVTGDFESEDFGRLLQAQGLALLQERKDLSEQTRIDLSYPLFAKAIHFNANQTETWINLGFIALKRADCANAAQDFSQAGATAEDKAKAKELVQYAQGIKVWTRAQCNAQSVDFHPYP